MNRLLRWGREGAMGQLRNYVLVTFLGPKFTNRKRNSGPGTERASFRALRNRLAHLQDPRNGLPNQPVGVVPSSNFQLFLFFGAQALTLYNNPTRAAMVSENLTIDRKSWYDKYKGEFKSVQPEQPPMPIIIYNEESKQGRPQEVEMVPPGSAAPPKAPAGPVREESQYPEDAETDEQDLERQRRIAAKVRAAGALYGGRNIPATDDDMENNNPDDSGEPSRESRQVEL